MFGIDIGPFGVFILIVVVAVFFLRGFDRMAGRGPKQIKDGINSTKKGRISCPFCAEAILPEAKKCPFCKSELK